MTETELILVIVRAKCDAARLGLWKTMHALDEAAQVIGWELADRLSKEKERRG